MPPRPLLAGNWKMNGLQAALPDLAVLREAVVRGVAGTAEMLVCPPATLIALAAETVGEAFALGGQDCHPDAAGAHTGDISAEMLADLGARYVIVGHSERRADHGETDAIVARKAAAAWRAGLCAIVCVGESRDERESGRETEVVGRQLDASIPDGATADRLVVAYEPVWAIGTGLTPSRDDVATVHTFIRTALIRRFGRDGEGMRILYGGSVNGANAADLLSAAEVGGALVGGASLRAADFLAIAAAYR
jgi:triosephosphate isomerase